MTKTKNKICYIINLSYKQNRKRVVKNVWKKNKRRMWNLWNLWNQK